MEQDYTLLYFHHGFKTENKPSLSWMLQVYRQLDRKYVCVCVCVCLCVCVCSVCLCVYTYIVCVWCLYKYGVFVQVYICTYVCLCGVCVWFVW